MSRIVQCRIVPMYRERTYSGASAITPLLPKRGDPSPRYTSVASQHPATGLLSFLGLSVSGFIFMDHLASSINTTLPTGTNKSSRGGGPVKRTQKENPRQDVSFSESDTVEIHPLYSSVSEYSLGSEYEQVVS
jgi:hypothetical protein